MYGMPTIQHPLCSRIEAIWCLASNQGLKKHTREPQRHGTVCAEYAIEALGRAASRLAQIEPLQDPTHSNVGGLLSHPSAIDFAPTFSELESLPTRAEARIQWGPGSADC